MRNDPTMTVSLSSVFASLDHSETTPQPLPSVEGPFGPEVTEWAIEGGEALPSETECQRRMHRLTAPERSQVTSALWGSDSAPLNKRALRIQACCVCPLIVQLSNGGVTVSPGLCRDRMCPTCQRLRAQAAKARLTEIVRSMNAPRFLTLTLRSSDAGLSAMLDRLYESFRQLRRRKEWKTHVLGGVAVTEVTRNADTNQWHAHLHVMIDGSFWKQGDIADLWESVTGDSRIVDIRAVHGVESRVKYLTAYLAKATNQREWSASTLCEYASAIHRRRLIQTFGKSHNVRVQEDDHGDAVVVAQVLVSGAKLLRAVHAKCVHAARAVVLLARVNPMVSRLVGFDWRNQPQCRVPLSADESAVLATLLRRVNGDRTGPLPFDPPVPVRETQLRCFNDAGQVAAAARRG